MNYRSLGSLELIVDHWLGACFDTGDIVSHWIKAGFGWVDLNDLFQLGLASLELLFPVLAVWLALFK